MRLTIIRYNNQSRIKISYNLVFHDKIKYFKNDGCFIRNKIKSNRIKVIYTNTQDQLMDMLIKSMVCTKFKLDCNRLSLKHLK